MIRDSIRNDLCLLILLPANNAARIYCNQIESSSICQIQMNNDYIQKGLIYTCIKQQPTKIKMFENQNIDLIKSEYNIQNNNNNSLISKKKTSLCLLDSLKNLTIDKTNNKISRDLIKQRRVKINKKYLSSLPMTNSIISPHTFNLWYNNNNNKKKNITNEQDYVIK
ncbi:unnamed protein product [Rotaria sordida]|uniref:Uncharacterized protein n=1 Tax=Rotaria sordida TaxID=392033 RepID=A0A813Y617_9BILA|nr:unnamed protein product [Rotaria sordida]CAF0875550.1 unnamed protein product [Rotaria sordida]CAF0877164.1 unnamed protein product [Rotaria sordida]CAF3489291.1 unnamed protein product [Rotaria sordida]